MYIKNIKLNNFRNYKNQEIKLEKNTNVFFGDNAVKTKDTFFIF